MANVEKMWLKIGFLYDLVVHMNGKWISNSPFPSHNGELSTKTNRIHDINTHKKWTVNPRSNDSSPSILDNYF